MDFCAEMKTAIGALLISFSLAGCSTQGYYSDMSMNTSYSQPKTVADVFFNWGKHTAYDVPRKDREQHETAIYSALELGNPGEVFRWRSKNSSGAVRVSIIHPNMCHDLTSTIWYKGRTKSWTDRACLKGNHWRFNTL
jgi:hypothetical protein